MGVGPDAACGGVSGGGDSCAHNAAAATSAITSEAGASILVIAAGCYHAAVGLRRYMRNDILRPMRVIKPGDFADERVTALLTRHLEGMHGNSPPGHVFALDWSGLQRPEISFYALWEGDELLGCGALNELGPRAGEIKSMRTADAHLRRGVAVAILEHIVAEARRRGYARLSLETGSGPTFEPALALYRKCGFIEGGAFGDYKKSPFNQFLHLDLEPV